MNGSTGHTARDDAGVNRVAFDCVRQTSEYNEFRVLAVLRNWRTKKGANNG